MATPDDLNTSAANPTQQREQPVARRFALRAVLAGSLGAIGAMLAGAVRPQAAAALAGPIEYDSTGSAPTIKGSNSGSGYGVVGEGLDTGVYGDGGTYGVRGYAFTAVFGDASNYTNGTGVLGKNLGGGYGAAGYGVYGQGDGYGVYGTSAGTGGGVNGTGVYGTSTGGGTGVQGMSTGGTGGNGVIGTASNGPGAVGVLGLSSTGYGFQGFTTAGPPAAGAAATNTSPGGSALVANASATSGSGIGAYCTCASPSGFGLGAYNTGGGYAGYFSGNVLVTGAFMVMGPKNAVVRDDGGSLRRMYSMESPESWFEDFGSGRLSGGSVMVSLEPGFARLVKTDDYHVFLTPYGEAETLHVGDRTASGFQVREGHGGTSSVSFGYRVVAKRKDIAGVRLEHVDEPPEPVLPVAPDLTHALVALQSTPPAPPPPPGS
jgi:hypothetical protein